MSNETEERISDKVRNYLEQLERKYKEVGLSRAIDAEIKVLTDIVYSGHESRLVDLINKHGICTDCGEMFSHDLYEPFASCPCKQAEWHDFTPYMKLEARIKTRETDVRQRCVDIINSELHSTTERKELISKIMNDNYVIPPREELNMGDMLATGSGGSCKFGTS